LFATLRPCDGQQQRVKSVAQTLRVEWAQRDGWMLTMERRRNNNDLYAVTLGFIARLPRRQLLHLISLVVDATPPTALRMHAHDRGETSRPMVCPFGNKINRKGARNLKEQRPKPRSQSLRKVTNFDM
jgi:hypothetical protein